MSNEQFVGTCYACPYRLMVGSKLKTHYLSRIIAMDTQGY